MRPSLTAADVCLFRFLYCGAVALALAFSLPHYADMHRDLAYAPIPLFRIFGTEPPPFGVFMSLGWALLVALVAAALGLATRLALALATLAYLGFFGLQLGFTKPLETGYAHHVKNLGVFVLAILAAAPGVGRFTIATLWSGRGAGDRICEQDRAIPAWPKALIIAGLGAAYFGAGFTKLVKDPLWLDGYTVQGILFKQHLSLDTTAGLWIAQSHLACLVLGGLAIAFELTFIVGAFVPRPRWLYVIGGPAMHLGFYLMVGANFLIYFCFAYFIFIEWHHLRRLFSRWNPVDMAPDSKRADAPLPDNSVRSSPRSRATWIAVAFAVVVFFLPVFARIEAWPFSDYRVFSGRTHPAEVEVLRFGGLDQNGEFHWLERRWQKELHRRFRVRLRASVEQGDTQETERLTTKAFSKLPKSLRQEFAVFQLIRRRLTHESDDDSDGKWITVDQVAASFTPDKP